MPSKYTEREKPWKNIEKLRENLHKSSMDIHWLIANIPGINGRTRFSLANELMLINDNLSNHIDRYEQELATKQEEPPTQKD